MLDRIPPRYVAVHGELYVLSTLDPPLVGPICTSSGTCAAFDLHCPADTPLQVVSLDEHTRGVRCGDQQAGAKR